MLAVRGSIGALMVVQLSLAGCSTQQIARFESKVGAMRCTRDRGLAEGSPAHQQCVAAYSAAAERERAETRAGLLGAAGVATQVWSAEEQGRARAAVSAPRSTLTYTPYTPAQQPLMSQQIDSNWNHICRYADGTEVNSGKNLCPPSITGRF